MNTTTTTNASSPASPESRRRGAILVFLAVGIVMLLAMSMLSVDVATMQLTRTELGAASDAAAKAGAEALLRTQQTATAKTAAMNMASLNRVGGKPLLLRTTDIAIGRSTRQEDGSWTFSSGGTRPNAVRVNAVMSENAGSGPVNLVFGKVFGNKTFEPTKVSTASVLEQEVCLSIDRSASMAWDVSGVEWSYPPGRDQNKPPHGTLSRWAALSHAVDAYLNAANESAIPPRVALVTWASDMGDAPRDQPIGSLILNLDAILALILPNYPVAQIELRLSNIYDNIRKILVWRSNSPIRGSTNMAAGIDKAVNVLTASDVRPFAIRSIILMTDGQWNEGRSPILAAEAARDLGIVIHVVSFLSQANTTDMDRVAEITGGRHIHTENEAELVRAFEELARTLPVVLTE